MLKNAPEKIVKLAETVRENGGRAMLVGGCVRDPLMGAQPKDWDVEIYKIEPEKLKEILQQFGRVDAVGESFTVYKIGQDFDVSLPRRERKTGRGHKGFAVEGDPNMSFEEACRRRDFTINAILQDVLTGEIVDPFDGRRDIERKIIRVVASETFVEDSLRVLRAAQFAARFEFEIEPETVELCRQTDLSDLPKERIWGEFEKLFLKAEKPSIGLKYFYDLKIAEKLFPELAALVGVPQNSEWHPEGWVFTALPSESFVTSVAQTLSVKRRQSIFNLRDFLFSSAASATVLPTSDGTTDTQTGDTFFPDVPSADSAAVSDVLKFSTTPPTTATQAEGFVWTFGNLTPVTEKVIRVMFQISLNNMRSIVRSAINDFEVLRGVVHPVAVFVVDMLTLLQGMTEHQLHNDPMNADSSIFSLPTGVNVPIVIVDARTSSVDNNVLFYFDLSFVGNTDFVHKIIRKYSSNCFEVRLGDVAYHTLLVVDEARKLIDDLPHAKKVAVMLGALCHDFGKPATTEFVDGAWRSHGHDEAGVEPTVSFLDRLGIFTLDGFDVREQVVELVRNHLRPGEFYKSKPGDGAFRRLARRVEPDLLYRVAKADSLGRNAPHVPKEKWKTSEAQEWFIERVRALKVEYAAPPPVLMGRHLLELGLKPSPRFREILDAVYEMQMDNRVRNLEEAVSEARKIIENGKRKTEN